MSKKVILLGINHNDPLGRTRVGCMLHMLKEELSFNPDHIAVEWAETHFRRVKEQRGEMKRLISDSFDFMTESDKDELSRSIAYEADSHLDIYPDLPIIWLDQRRVDNADESAIENYASERMKILRKQMPTKSQADQAMMMLSRNLWALTNKNKILEGTDRDRAFHEITMDALENDSIKIVSIVGAYHADENVEGTYANLLLLDGIDVKTYLGCDF